MNRITLPNSLMLGEVCKLLAEGRDVVLLTRGVSMRPFIEGDRDSVTLRAKSHVEPGDIALAQIRPGVYVLYRVRAVEHGMVRLKGDGNLRGIEICPEKEVYGTVIEIIRPGDRRVDPSSGRMMFRWKIWKTLPCIVRRGVLWIYRKTRKNAII